MSAAILTLARMVSAVGILTHLALASTFLGTIALALVFEYKHIRSGDPDYLSLSRKFSVISTIVFGVGAAYGTLVEFGLVTVWSSFVTAIGAISLPFFLELFAFLFEVVVLPLYAFTWGKIKNGWNHFLIGVVAAFGGYWSAYNILAVMASLSMKPPGLEIVNLQAQGQSIGGVIPFALEWASPSDIFNMYWYGAQVFIFHGILAAVILSWSIVAGFYINNYMKERDQQHKKALNVILIPIAVLTAIQGLVIGHYQGELVLADDPLKLAALEGFFWNGLKVDPLLSFLAYGTLNHQFWGLYSWPSYMWPPFYVTAAYLVMMVGFGIVLGIITLAAGLYLAFGERLSRIWLGWLNRIGPSLLSIGRYLIPASASISAIGGALSAESGRFPFIFVSSVPQVNGPPQIVGVPVTELLNVNLSLPAWLVVLMVLAELLIPLTAAYGIYLYTKRGGE